MTRFSPIESEFASSDEAMAYDAWFRAKVQKALDSNAPSVPHDTVMAEMRSIVERKRRDDPPVA